MEIESEAATDPEEIDDLEYSLGLKEGRMVADTKILAIRILNDLIENLPIRVETLAHVIRGGKGGKGNPEMGKDSPCPKMTKEQTPPKSKISKLLNIFLATRVIWDSLLAGLGENKVCGPPTHPPRGIHRHHPP